MRKITEELLMQLKNASDIDSFFDANKNKLVDLDTCGYLNEMLEMKNMSLSSLSKKSGVGEYVYKVFRGERKASRDVLISIAFGMNLQLEETQFLLRISKFAVLDSRDKRDSVIIFCLTHLKDVFETDDMLEEYNLATIVK